MKTLTLLCSLMLLAGGHGRGGSGSVRILTYHSFLGDKNIYSFSLNELRQQCAELKSRGFVFVTFDDIRKGSLTGDRNVLITIDDGHRTVYDAFKKVLAPMGIRPLLAIYPAVIGSKGYALTWEQVRELDGAGCTIASHGYHHNFVTESARRKNPRDFNREIFKSKAVLEKKLGRPVDIFVYPFGAYSPVTIEAVRKAGYKYAMDIKGGPARLSGGHVFHSYKIPRYLTTRKNMAGIIAMFKRTKKHRALSHREFTMKRQVLREAPGITQRPGRGIPYSEAEIEVAGPVKYTVLEYDDRETQLSAAASPPAHAGGLPAVTGEDIEEESSGTASLFFTGWVPVKMKLKIYEIAVNMRLVFRDFIVLIRERTLYLKNRVRDFLKERHIIAGGGLGGLVSQ